MTVAVPERTAPAIALPNRAGPLSLGQMTPYEAWQFAETLANTPLLPDAYRRQPASVLWAMEYGRALGLDVVTTITTIHVIKGKPTQSADLMLSRAREAGHRVRIRPERDRCTVAIQRHDDPDDETVIEWTLDDAVTACLCEMRNGRPYSRDDKNRPQSWEKYPRAMLRSRAIAEAVRTACPEVLHGAIYTPEELGAVVDQEGNAVVVERADGPPVEQTATVVQSTPNQAPAAPQRDYLAEAMATTDGAALVAIAQAAAAAGAPANYLGWIDDIHEAQQLRDVAAVRGLYKKVQAEGAPAEHLARIAHIGEGKPGSADPMASTAESGTPTAAVTERASDSPRPDAPTASGPGRQAEAEHAAALADMYAAARAAGMTSQGEADAAFHGLLKVTPAIATVAQLQEQAATLRQIAGVQ